jgi:hypothetical protein
VVLAALLPRLWQIGAFITPDETLFLDYARRFLRGLGSGNLTLTYGLGYPGVPLVWANSLGLLAMFLVSRLGLLPALPAGLSLNQFLDGLDIQVLPYYAAARVGTVALVTLLLLLIYILGRRLYGTPLALFSSLLLAFDPSMLGYSRLVHMAVPLALLMFLVILAWLLWLLERRNRWLVLTGLFCGMAISTITMGLLVLPALLGLALLAKLAQRPAEGRDLSESSKLPGRYFLELRTRLSEGFRPWLGRTLLQWLAVVVVGAATFWAMWPAMWIDPAGALWLTFDWLVKNANAGFGNWGMFWMGTFLLDPGPAFYPLLLLLKMSPLMLVGIICSLLFWRRARRPATAQAEGQSPACGQHWPVIQVSLWAYVLFFLVTMTFGTSKSVRYLLPPLAALAPLAGFGWLQLGQWVASRVPAWRRSIRYARLGGWTVAGALLVGPVLAYAPYYLTYYNPLLVGWVWVPRAVQVGWGEGLDVAARYLNSQPDAASKQVAAWYDWAFAPYFAGKTLQFSGENAIQADYSVLYINQVQRKTPDPNLISYFQRRQPEYVVRLNGIDYAWVYPAVHSDGPLPPGATPVGIRMGAAVTLEGYTVRPAAAPAAGVVVSLYWRALRSDLPDYFVYVRAVDPTDQVRARADSPPVMGFWPTSRWRAGQLVADEQILARLPETPAGSYRLEVGMYDPASWAVLEPAGGQRGQGGGIILGEIDLPE